MLGLLCAEALNPDEIFETPHSLLCQFDLQLHLPLGLHSSSGGD